MPTAGLPGQADPVPVLCHGLIRTAERLRAAARRAVPVATWSPGFTRESMRQSAACCAVTASSLRILLRTLAEHEDACTGPISASLANAAEAVDRSRVAWLRVAGAWDTVTTDTRGYVSPAAAEAASLALWAGRLAYDRPDWTPSLGPRHEPRAAAELTATKEDFGPTCPNAALAARDQVARSEASRPTWRTKTQAIIGNEHATSCISMRQANSRSSA